MAICIKGHYGTRHPKDVSARRAQEVQENWHEYRKDVTNGVVHKRKSQKKAIKQLYGEGMTPSAEELKK